jgi:RNA polymerase sigma factor (sigma-70 family)
MAFFLKRTGDHAEAEDLTQDTFSRVFGGASGGTGLHAGYIFQVAANLLRDRARRQKVRNDAQDTLGIYYGRSVDLLDPEKIAVARDTIVALTAGLADLPERTRVIFILYRIENIGKPMIAESFGISTSAVEKHITRAMAHLMARARNEPQ